MRASFRLPARWLVAIGICAIVATLASQASAGFRLAMVLARRLGSEATFRPRGPEAIATMTLTLLPGPGSERDPAPIPVRVWFPVQTACGPPARPRCAATKPGRDADAVSGRLPVLLYAPGLRGPHDDNAMTAADVASHGYVVVAMDDIDWHPAGDGAGSNLVNDFDMSSPEAFRTMLRRLDTKVRRQAVRAGWILDRLAGETALAAAPWLADLDLNHVGFFGWSFGGATAQEASVVDGRIVAAVNMDGWLFGDAAAGRQTKPSMTILSDYAAPRLATLSSRNDTTRFNAMMDVRDLREKIRLGLGPDGYFVRMPGAIHENYADKIFDLARWRFWARADPYATKRKVDEDLVAFFDRYMARPPGPRLADARPSLADADFLAASKDWLDWCGQTKIDQNCAP